MCCALQEADRRVNAGRRSAPLRLLAARIYPTPPPRSPSNTAFTTGDGLQKLAAARCKRTFCQFATATSQEGADEDSQPLGPISSPMQARSAPSRGPGLLRRSRTFRCAIPVFTVPQSEQLLPETSSNNASSKLVTALFDCHRPAWALPGKTQNKPRALPDNPDSSQADTTAQRNTALEMRGSRTQKRQEHKALVLI